MIKYFLVLIVFPLFVAGQSRIGSGTIDWKKEHISFGLGGNSSGFSLLSYTLNLFREKNTSYYADNNKKTEYFISAGTNIIQNNMSIGLKRLLLESNLNKKLYSSISVTGEYGLGKVDDFLGICIAIGLDIPMRHHQNYKFSPQHPLMWPLKPFTSINKILAKNINSSIKKKEYLNVGFRATIKSNKIKSGFLLWPYINLSYRW